MEIFVYQYFLVKDKDFGVRFELVWLLQLHIGPSRAGHSYLFIHDMVSIEDDWRYQQQEFMVEIFKN